MRRTLYPALLPLACAAVAIAQAPPPAGFPGEPPPSPPVVIRDFSADPATIQAEPDWFAMLRWEVLNAYSLTIEPEIGVVPTRGARRVVPAATTTYTLTATGPGGATTRTVTVTVAGTVATTAGQTTTPQPTPIPRLANGKPDLSGVYSADRNVRLVAEPEIKAGAVSFRVPQAVERDAGTGDDCLPPGVPAATMLPFPLLIVLTPDVVAFLYEAYHQFRIARNRQEPPISGEAHPEYLAPTWMGHSVAWWDGDTLTVDARGFNGRLVIAGYRTTQALRVLEHYRRTSYDTIAYDAYVSDANVFAEPVRYSGTLTLHPEWEIGEYVCAENNQDYDELFED
jgi:hypothetical protein